MGDQGTVADFHRRGQVKYTIDEVILRAGGGGNVGQQIVVVGIIHRYGILLDLGGAVFRLHSILNKNSG